MPIGTREDNLKPIRPTTTYGLLLRIHTSSLVANLRKPPHRETLTELPRGAASVWTQVRTVHIRRVTWALWESYYPPTQMLKMTNMTAPLKLTAHAVSPSTMRSTSSGSQRLSRNVSILGLGLPSSIRFPMFRGGSTASSVVSTAQSSSNRLSVESDEWFPGVVR